MGICTVEDSYVRHSLRWVVRLNDGTIVYQDDDRPGENPPSAWLRLRQHCIETGAYPVEMRLQFGTNIVPLPADKDGYFFSKFAYAVWGQVETGYGYVAGYLQDGRVHATTYQTPELLRITSDVRDVAEDSPNLIAKHHVLSVGLRGDAEAVSPPEAGGDGLREDGREPGDEPPE